MQHVLDIASVNSRRRDFNGDAARPEGLRFKTIAGQFVGNFSEHCLLSGREFENQWHQQTLAFNFLCATLLQNLFEEHALMGHVLVNDPQPFPVHRQDERLPNLAQRFKRGEYGRKRRIDFFRLVGNRRCATVPRHLPPSN